MSKRSELLDRLFTIEARAINTKQGLAMVVTCDPYGRLDWVEFATGTTESGGPHITKEEIISLINKRLGENYFKERNNGLD